MNISRETNSVLAGAAIYAGRNRYEYITPEMVLLSFCGLKVFRDAFGECGGDIEALKTDLTGYCQNYIEKLELNEGAQDEKQTEGSRFRCKKDKPPLSRLPRFSIQHSLRPRLFLKQAG